MHVPTPREFIEIFENFRNEHEKHWINVAKMLKFIKEFSRYEDFGNFSFEDFLENWFWYERTNAKRYLKALEYIEKNHSELLEENNKNYIPPYEYIEYIYRKKLTKEQTKEMDRLVFKGMPKKFLLEKYNEYVNTNLSLGMKIEIKSKKILKYSNNIIRELQNLLEIYPIHNYHYEELKNLILPAKNWFDNFIKQITNVMKP